MTADAACIRWPIAAPGFLLRVRSNCLIRNVNTTWSICDMLDGARIVGFWDNAAEPLGSMPRPFDRLQCHIEREESVEEHCLAIATAVKAATGDSLPIDIE